MGFRKECWGLRSSNPEPFHLHLRDCQVIRPRAGYAVICASYLCILSYRGLGGEVIVSWISIHFIIVQGKSFSGAPKV